MVWDAFVELEDNGGMTWSVQSNYWHTRLGQSMKRRDDAINTGQFPKVGVTHFPDPNEQVIGDWLINSKYNESLHRDVEWLERLRISFSSLDAPSVLIWCQKPAVEMKRAIDICQQTLAMIGWRGTVVDNIEGKNSDLVCLCGVEKDTASTIQLLLDSGTRMVLWTGKPIGEFEKWRLYPEQNWKTLLQGILSDFIQGERL